MIEGHRLLDLAFVSGEGWRFVCSCEQTPEPVRSSYSARKDWVWHAATAQKETAR